MMKLYIYTTRDDLELPLIVEDNAQALARKLGTTENVVLSSISHKVRGFERIIIDDEDDMRMQ